MVRFLFSKLRAVATAFLSIHFNPLGTWSLEVIAQYQSQIQTESHPAHCEINDRLIDDPSDLGEQEPFSLTSRGRNPTNWNWTSFATVYFC